MGQMRGWSVECVQADCATDGRPARGVESSSRNRYLSTYLIHGALQKATKEK